MKALSYLERVIYRTSFPIRQDLKQMLMLSSLPRNQKLWAHSITPFQKLHPNTQLLG